MNKKSAMYLRSHISTDVQSKEYALCKKKKRFQNIVLLFVLDLYSVHTCGDEHESIQEPLGNSLPRDSHMSPCLLPDAYVWLCVLLRHTTLNKHTCKGNVSS